MFGKYLLVLCGVLVISLGTATADTLDLAFCHQEAIRLSPLQQQVLLYSSAELLQDQSLQKRNLPQMGLRGQATYQSDVITFPEQPPGVPVDLGFPVLPKFQYNVALDVNQKIYDGGGVKYGRELNAVDRQVRDQQLVVDLNQIKQVINQLYFAILLKDKQSEIFASTLGLLDDRLKVVESGVRNGVLLPGSENTLRKQILSTEQELDQIASDRMALLKTLGEWIGREDVETLELKAPEDPTIDIQNLSEYDRPEHKLFDLQHQKLELQKSGLKVNNRPFFSAFGTLGLGAPNPVNFLEVTPSPYYIVGVRASWNFWDWKSQSRNQELLGVQQQILASQRSNFDKMLRTDLIKDIEQERSAQSLQEKDEQIIALQEKILRQSESQLDNGVITSADYLDELNALTAAKLKLELRRLQERQAQINALTKAGKF